MCCAISITGTVVSNTLEMAPKKIIIAQVVSIGILVGFGAWLFVAFGSVSNTITCFLDQIDALKAVKGKAGESAAEYAGLIPSSVTDLVRTYLPLLAVLVIAPAALIAIIELLIVFCSSNPCKNSRKDEICAKLLILLLQLFLVIGIVCYLVIGGAGIAINQPEVQSMIGAIDTVCDESLPTLKTQLDGFRATLTSAKADLDAAPVGAVPASTQKAFDDADFELNEADKSLAAMTQICTCIDDTFSLLGSFTVPGLGCAAGCVLLMILNCAACCALGICGGKKKKEDEQKGTEVTASV